MSPLRHNHFLSPALIAASILSAAIFALILGFLFWQSVPVLRAVGLLRFFTDESWHPNSGLFNLSPMITGSIAITFGSILLATPISLGLALFINYSSTSSLAWITRRFIELLASIPSVIYGLWGMTVLVPIIAECHAPGTSLLAGTLVLSLMILPTIALSIDASLRNIPLSLHQASQALGLSRSTFALRIALPQAHHGIEIGILLGTTRALGETMAVLMVCGNRIEHPQSVFDSMRTLTANIALEMSYAMDLHRSALFFSGFLLLSGVLGFMFFIPRLRRLLAQRGQRPYV